MFETLLPDAPHYCISYGRQAPNRWAYVASTSELLPKSLELQAEGYKTWVAIAGFTSSNTARNEENVHAVRSLIADIDCSPEKGGYATKAEALQALFVLVSGGTIPHPTAVIDSGGGLHCWWSLGQDVSVAEWKPLASRLKRAMELRDAKLTCDPTCFTRASGLLRLPGTTNYKYTPPRKVKVLLTGPTYTPSDMNKALPGDSGAVARPATSRVSVIKRITGPRSQVDGELMINSCVPMGHYYDNRATASEPQWQTAIHLTAFMRDGEAMAHALSEGHPGYDPSATETKYLAALDYAENNGGGPVSCTSLCSTMGLIYDDACARCPLFKAGTTANPVKLTTDLESAAKMAPAPVAQPLPLPSDLTSGVFEARVQDAMLETSVYGLEEVKPPEWLSLGDRPSGWFVNAGGLQHRAPLSDITEHSDGEVSQQLGDTRLTETAFWPIQQMGRGVDSTIQFGARARVAAPGEEPDSWTFELPSQSLGDVKGLVKLLNAHGVRVLPHAVKKLNHYMSTWERPLEQRGALALGGLGWQRDGSFAVGGIHISKAGLRGVTLGSDAYRVTHLHIHHTGTLAGALDVVRAYAAHGSEEARFAFISAFASPLFTFAGESAVILHMVGASGTGKSSVARAIASVYGRPNEKHIQAHDTAKSNENMQAGFRHLPVTYDEVTQLSAERKVSLSMEVSAGRSNMARAANGTGELRSGDRSWSNIMVSSANSSIQRQIAAVCGAEHETAARQKRVFEVSIGGPTLPETMVADINAKIGANYGMLGLHYMAYVVNNRAEIAARVAALKHELMLRMPAEDRFWGALIAAHTAAAEVMEKLGYWDVKASWVMRIGEKLADEQRSSISTTQLRAGDLVASYLTENYSGIEHLNNGRQTGNITGMRGAIMGSRDTTAGGSIISVPKMAFEKYCRTEKASVSALLHAALLEGILVESGRVDHIHTHEFASGPGVPVPCYRFKLKPIASPLAQLPPTSRQLR